MEKLPLNGFRPQDAPIVAIDHFLPAVPTEYLKAEALRYQFARSVNDFKNTRLNESNSFQRAMNAAVLLPIVQRVEPTLLLTQRAKHLRHHSGEVALPGGRIELSDASIEVAALREAQEEVGLNPASVEVLGRLRNHVTNSGFNVAVVVALIPANLQLQSNPDEVDDIFEVPLRYVLNPANHRHHIYQKNGVDYKWLSMVYETQGVERVIWGATASILRGFYHFLMPSDKNRPDQSDKWCK